MLKDQTDHKGEIARLVPGLRRYARALVARESADPIHDADALARETLARAQRGMRAANPRIWLFATLTALNRVRVRARSARAAEAGRPGNGVTDALDAVPLDQREALLLVVLEGFSYAEAADILGLSRAAIGARVARARAALEVGLDTGPKDGRRTPKPHPHLRLVK